MSQCDVKQFAFDQEDEKPKGEGMRMHSLAGGGGSQKTIQLGTKESQLLHLDLFYEITLLYRAFFRIQHSLLQGLGFD